MKICISLSSLILILFVSYATASTRIDSDKAAFHVGENIMVCGKAADIAKLKNRTVINIGNVYPREDINILIWDNNLPIIEERLGPIDNLKNKKLCASGTIDVYKEHLQIQISNPKMLRLMK